MRVRREDYGPDLPPVVPWLENLSERVDALARGPRKVLKWPDAGEAMRSSPGQLEDPRKVALPKHKDDAKRPRDDRLRPLLSLLYSRRDEFVPESELRKEYTGRNLGADFSNLKTRYKIVTVPSPKNATFRGRQLKSFPSWLPAWLDAT